MDSHAELLRSQQPRRGRCKRLRPNSLPTPEEVARTWRPGEAIARPRRRARARAASTTAALVRPALGIRPLGQERKDRVGRFLRILPVRVVACAFDHPVLAHSGRKQANKPTSAAALASGVGKSESFLPITTITGQRTLANSAAAFFNVALELTISCAARTLARALFAQISNAEFDSFERGLAAVITNLRTHLASTGSRSGARSAVSRGS
jgi:hypothetical protein